MFNLLIYKDSEKIGFCTIRQRKNKIFYLNFRNLSQSINSTNCYLIEIRNFAITSPFLQFTVKK